MNFEPFPKVPRLSREIIVTEKIDGTNASVMIVERRGLAADEVLANPGLGYGVGDFILLAGSRTRWITPADDNFGFAAWVIEHAEELVAGLGPGHHFGEWWGRGIQRGYGLTERRFSLFNVGRWLVSEIHDERTVCCPLCCDVVPVLYRGPMSTPHIDAALHRLVLDGSYAAPGYHHPEGIMVYHSAANALFKKTIEDDEISKSQVKRPKVQRPPKDPNVGGRRKANVGAPDGAERRRAR